VDTIQDWIAEGEHQRQDFKFAINDSRKIAIALSAFANTDGGRLLIGVKDNGRIAGIRSDEEIYMVEAAAEMYCQPPPEVYYQPLEADDREVLLVDVLPSENKPIKAIDAEGKPWAYVRSGDRNFLASPVHLALWRRTQGETLTQRSAFGARETEMLKLLGTEPMWKLNALVKASGLPRNAVLNRLGDFLYWKLIELVRIEDEYRIRLSEV